jgi:ATP-dependent DNA ligase
MAQYKTNGHYNFDWNAVTQLAQQRGLSASDLTLLQNQLRSLPTPQQTEFALEAFIKDSNQDHPAARIAGAWKAEHKMKFVNIDKMPEIIGDDKGTISAKLDGELIALIWDGQKAITITPKGTIRSGLPATEETTGLLKNFKTAVFMGEFYATDESGKPQSYMKAASILRDPNSKKDHLIRISIFDVIALDGKDVSDLPIAEKMSKIAEIFNQGGKHIHAAPSTQGGMTDIKKQWDVLEERGWEGLVVHLGSIIYKIKPILSYDMVVVAIEKSPRFVDRIGAALCAFIDKEGAFRLDGSVGGGFTDEEKVWILDWANKNKVREDEDRIWVDPFKEPLIVEVEAMEVNIKDQPKMDFKDRKWVQIEEDISGVLRFPHVKRIRDDKDPTHRDVAVEQLPLEQKSSVMTFDMLRMYDPQQAPHVLVPGKHVKTITGQTGCIMELVPKSGDSRLDFDVIVQWDAPLWGEIPVSEIHPTEIVEVH